MAVGRGIWVGVVVALVIILAVSSYAVFYYPKGKASITAGSVTTGAETLITQDGITTLCPSPTNPMCSLTTNSTTRIAANTNTTTASTSESCTPAITITQTYDNSTQTQTITLCHILVTTTLDSRSTGTTTSTICVVPVEGTGTYLHIVSDSTQQPLPGITVNVLPTANSCFGFGIPGPATYTTNATGWVSIEGMPANYYFQTSVTYAGRSYNFSLPQGPLDTTNATLSLPSGNLSISLCYSMTTVNPCRPYTESATATGG